MDRFDDRTAHHMETVQNTVAQKLSALADDADSTSLVYFAQSMGVTRGDIDYFGEGIIFFRDNSTLQVDGIKIIFQDQHGMRYRIKDLDDEWMEARAQETMRHGKGRYQPR